MNKKLITEEQKDYQKELMSNFRDFCDKLEPMVNVKKKHKRSRYNRLIINFVCVQYSLEWITYRDRALINIAGTGNTRSSRHLSSSSANAEAN